MLRDPATAPGKFSSAAILMGNRLSSERERRQTLAQPGD